MTTPGLLAVVNDLANEVFGYDWFDLRDRLERWLLENPEAGRDLIHYGRLLLEEWDHA